MKKNLMLILSTIIIYTIFLLPFCDILESKAEVLKVSNEKPGMVEAYFSDTIPSGYLLCDGRAVSRTTYADLFDIIGTTYGSGDGSTTFNLPNYQGKVIAGKNSGTFNTLGKTGGEETHKLTAAELASHSHDMSSGTVSTKSLIGKTWNLAYQSKTYMGSASGIIKQEREVLEAAYVGGGGSKSGIDPGFTINLTHNHTLSGYTSEIGSDGAHNNLQPYTVVNYIIKY